MATQRQWDTHSRLVFWLKILLPITAIFVLSTLFLVSHVIRPEDAVPYANVDVATLVREPRLTAPVFAGMTADGAALSLKASSARIGSTDGATTARISDLVGLLETPDGAKTTLAAGQAALDPSGKIALLTGAVQVSNSTGYVIDSQGVSVALDQTRVDSPGPITAMGPVGKLTAGAMHLGLASAGSASYVLLFTGGVTLIYLPSKQPTGN